MTKFESFILRLFAWVGFIGFCAAVVISDGVAEVRGWHIVMMAVCLTVFAASALTYETRRDKRAHIKNTARVQCPKQLYVKRY